jgi:site-specific DNA-methyltransferase (adenine-specific)
MGAAVLHLGDCLEVLRGLPDGCVDAVVTDPPYGTKVTGWDESIEAEVFRECLRVSRGYCTFFYSNTRLWHILGILHALGVDSWVIPWHKPNAIGFERKFAPQWVPIVCAYRPGAGHWGQDFVAEPLTPQRVGHPTPKPPRVMRWLVRRACPPGGTVLDPFMGSGTTGVAAIMEGRDFVGVEISPEYFAIAERRIREAEACRDGRGVGELFAWGEGEAPESA